MPSKIILVLVDDESTAVKHVLIHINDAFTADRESAAALLAGNSRLTSVAFRGASSLFFGDFSALEEALTPEQASEMSDHGAVLYPNAPDVLRLTLNTKSMDLCDIHFDAQGFQVSGVLKYDFTRVLSRHILFDFLEERVTA